MHCPTDYCSQLRLSKAFATGFNEHCAAAFDQVLGSGMELFQVGDTSVFLPFCQIFGSVMLLFGSAACIAWHSR